MPRAFVVILCVCIAVVTATTLPEFIDRCDPDLASDKSTDCGTDALFCTGYAFLGRDTDGNPERKTGCRPCEVMAQGAQPDSAVHDPLNVCNCVGGEFCRHTGLANDPDNREIGYCAVSQLLGTPCNSSDQCVTADREDSTDGGKARAEVGFCVRGRCGQCDPATFAREMGSSQHVCPGYTQLSDGARVYHNSMPGVVVSCSDDGHLVTSGQPNFELKAGNAPPPPQADPTPAAEKNDEEPGYVLGLLVTIFILVVTIVLLLALIAFGVWRLRTAGRAAPVRLNE